MAAVLCDACMHGEPLATCHWKHACNEVNGWKLITACLTIHLSWGPYLAMGGPVLAAKTSPPD